MRKFLTRIAAFGGGLTVVVVLVACGSAEVVEPTTTAATVTPVVPRPVTSDSLSPTIGPQATETAPAG